MISDDQFQTLADKLNNPDIGGFTADLRRGGRSPRSKYMVGQRDVEEGAHALPSTGPSIRQYAEANRETVMKPGRFLGGWAGNEGNLDVPAGFPRTPEGEVQARWSTMANTQMAYGELNTSGNYVGDRTNPFHPVMREGDIHPSDDPGQRQIWAEMPLHTAQFGKPGKRRQPLPESESFS